MTRKMEGMGFVNVMANEGDEPPETFKWGKKTIDHIWSSKDVLDNIENKGYCQYDLILNSDHRLMFVNLRNNESQ